MANTPKRYQWLKDIESLLTEYNEGQLENSENNNIIVMGRPRTGKNYLLSWLKEISLRTDNAKLIESHASEVAHLSEIYEFMFPNGFFKKIQGIEEVKKIKVQLKKDSYNDPWMDLNRANNLIKSLKEDTVNKRIQKISDYLDEETNYSLRKRLENIKEQQQEILDDIKAIDENVSRNPGIPSSIRSAYEQGGGINTSYSMEIFVPISMDMPQCPMPDHWTPFTIPVNDYVRGDMEWGLKILHGNNYDKYQKIYSSLMKAGHDTYADLKNVDTLPGKEYVEKQEYAEGSESIKVTTNLKGNKAQVKSFARDWDGMFVGDGVVSNPDFEHVLRPKLKNAILSDDPQVIVLYTGFLSNSEIQKFVMTYFMETYRSIMQNLSGKEIEELDRDYWMSILEAQEAVKVSGQDTDLSHADKQYNLFIKEFLNNSGHFGTTVLTDVKADEAHRILLSKSSIRVVTQMEREDFETGKWDKDVKNNLLEAFNDPFYQSYRNGLPSYGFNVLTRDNVPSWKLYGRNTYGHRLPCPRTTTDKPLDSISNSDFSFFHETLVELGYMDLDEDFIHFKEYQDQLFKEHWQGKENQYIEARDEKKKKEEQEQEDGGADQSEREMRKTVACSLLEAKVRKRNKVPSTWAELHEQVLSEMKERGLVPGDFNRKTIESYTKDVREELKEEVRENTKELDPRSIADSIKQDGELLKQFLFGATSTDEKKYLAKNYVLDNYNVDGDTVAENIAGDVVQAISIHFKSKGWMGGTHKPKIEEDEFDELLGLNVEDDSGGVEGGDPGGMGGGSDGDTGVNQGQGQVEDEDDVENQDQQEQEDVVSESPITDDRDLEAPSEEWSCGCGAFNEPGRAVCYNCAKTWEETREE